MKWFKTTGMGVMTILAAVLNVAILLLDGNSNTNPDWPITIGALTAGWGLIMAKDDQPAQPTP